MKERNYREWILSRKDNFKHRGYNWRGKIFKKSVSPFLFATDDKITDMTFLEILLDFILDHIKTIKKSMMWVYNRNFTDFN